MSKETSLPLTYQEKAKVSEKVNLFDSTEPMPVSKEVVAVTEEDDD